LKYYYNQYLYFLMVVVVVIVFGVCPFLIINYLEDFSVTQSDWFKSVALVTTNYFGF
jgi:hypothetical protein